MLNAWLNGWQMAVRVEESHTIPAHSIVMMMLFLRDHIVLLPTILLSICFRPSIESASTLGLFWWAVLATLHQLCTPHFPAIIFGNRRRFFPPYILRIFEVPAHFHFRRPPLAGTYGRRTHDIPEPDKSIPGGYWTCIPAGEPL